jgi:hypothetical protein
MDMGLQAAIEDRLIRELIDELNKDNGIYRSLFQSNLRDQTPEFKAALSEFRSTLNDSELRRGLFLQLTRLVNLERTETR